MKQVILLAILLSCCLHTMQAQTKAHLEQFQANKGKTYDIRPIETSLRTDGVPRAQRPLSGGLYENFKALPSLTTPTAALQQLTITRSPETKLPIAIYGSVAHLPINVDKSDAGYTEQAYLYLEAVQSVLGIQHPRAEFTVTKIETDKLGITHIRMQQQYRGVTVHGGEIMLHSKSGKIYFFNGHYFPTPQLQTLTPAISEQEAIQLALNEVNAVTKFQELKGWMKEKLGGKQIWSELVIFHNNDNPMQEQLLWKVEIVPHLAADKVYFLNAENGTIVQQFDKICHLDAHHAELKAAAKAQAKKVSSKLPTVLPPDGPATAQAVDLNGVTQTIHTYQVGNRYLMLDGSRPMFNLAGSQIPNNPKGALITLDAQNTNPNDGNFDPDYAFSTTNVWNDRNDVSAHYNASRAYEYFRTTFGRNSIDGLGGTIISITNVTDENGEQMDNAFWGNVAMFYGNGNIGFKQLAGGLDVAGHEMSHGVIQATAGLEYLSQSGAMNESFADIFGAMLDRDDWKIGEDVVNTNVYTSGTMRDMQNPNNGGTNLSHRGWQPKHMNEYQNLPPTEDGDNGGVHINSGILNRAYYLLATATSKNKAEQIYYRALTNYLVRSSQFIDLRIAAIQAATDLHGANSTETNAVRAAFDAVGIMGGQGTDTQTDLDPNPGQELVLLTDANFSALYLADGNGNILNNPLINQRILSKPSVTDDGSLAVFVANDGSLRFINFAAQQTGYIENNPQFIWRNVVISKDGQRIAALTDNLVPEILVVDLNSGQQKTYQLYNPTTAAGITTGDVQYADALEFTYDGEFLMYDSYNELGSIFGGRGNYWDIKFLRVWDTRTNRFGDGLVLNLFDNLEANSSIGNPTFAKNSPYIIAFDFINHATEEYYLVGVNIETGDLDVLFENQDLSYPNYAIDDRYIYFDAFDNQSNPVIAYLQLAANKISAAGQASIFISGGKWGVSFGTGERVITDVEQTIASNSFTLAPNPFTETIQLQFEQATTEQFNYIVTDIVGKSLLQGIVPKGQSSVDVNLANLPVGTYLLQVTSGKEKAVQKIVKMK